MASALSAIGVVIAAAIPSAVQEPAAAAYAPFFRDADATLITVKVCRQQPIDQETALVIVGGSRSRRASCAQEPWFLGDGDAYGFFLVDRAGGGPVSLLTLLRPAQPRSNDSRVLEIALRLERAGASSFVLWEGRPDYGFGTRRVKFFFDVRARRLLERVEYPLDVGMTHIAQVGERLCATFRTTPKSGVLACEHDGTFAIESTAALDPPSHDPPPPPSELPPPPQSTWDEFARARPDRVANGYRRGGTVIDERVGPWQRRGDHVWFGRTFYDGEGHTGVGAIGVFDPAARRFSFISPAAMVDWSASALLIEDAVAWVGLVRHPEGASYGHGLLRVDLDNGGAERTPVPDIITGIVRWRGALYLATDNGIYLVDGQVRQRHRLEPSRSGSVMIVSERFR